MNRYIKLGNEGIELELPVHALYIYRDSEQLLSDIVPLIEEASARKEKCIFIGKEKDRKFLKTKFKKLINTVNKEIRPGDFVSWIKKEYDKLPKNYNGLRVFWECSKEFLISLKDILMCLLSI